MNRFKHWFAAAMFLVVIVSTTVGILATVIYFTYLTVAEFPSFVAIIAGCALFIGGTWWSERYIRDHGWPWKPKPESERVTHEK